MTADAPERLAGREPTPAQAYDDQHLDPRLRAVLQQRPELHRAVAEQPSPAQQAPFHGVEKEQLHEDAHDEGGAEGEEQRAGQPEEPRQPALVDWRS